MPAFVEPSDQPAFWALGRVNCGRQTIHDLRFGRHHARLPQRPKLRRPRRPPRLLPRLPPQHLVPIKPIHLRRLAVRPDKPHELVDAAPRRPGPLLIEPHHEHAVIHHSPSRHQRRTMGRPPHQEVIQLAHQRPLLRGRQLTVRHMHPQPGPPRQFLQSHTPKVSPACRAALLLHCTVSAKSDSQDSCVPASWRKARSCNHGSKTSISEGIGDCRNPSTSRATL